MIDNGAETKPTNDQQRHHPRNDSEDRRARAQSLGKKHHRATEHNLKRERVTQCEIERIVKPGWKSILRNHKFYELRGPPTKTLHPMRAFNSYRVVS